MSKKRVIVIRGSEDGVLGVAGNLKRAVEIANQCNYPVTYKEALKVKKRETYELPHVSVDVGTDGCYVEFDYYYLNT